MAEVMRPGARQKNTGAALQILGMGIGALAGSPQAGAAIGGAIGGAADNKQASAPQVPQADNAISRRLSSMQESDPVKMHQLANDGLKQLAMLSPEQRKPLVAPALQTYKQMTGKLPPSPDELGVV